MLFAGGTVGGVVSAVSSQARADEGCTFWGTCYGYSYDCEYYDICDCTCENPCEGYNPFSASNGDAKRTIEDLNGGTMQPAHGARISRQGLSWKRNHATKVQRDAASYFGGGGTWRHNWQYALSEVPGTDGTPPSLVFVSPAGTRHILKPGAKDQWAEGPGLPETAMEKDGGIEVKNSQGVTYFFARSGGTQVGATGNRYQMTRLTNIQGLVTYLQYDQQGWLTSVTDPGGRSLRLAYRDIPGIGGSRFVLATVQQAPGSGQWAEYIVPAELRNQLLRHLRFRAADHTEVGVAEVQFFAPDSSQPLTGKVTGSNPSAQAAFDGDPHTSFVSTVDTVGYCGLDLGGTGSQDARIRILAQPGQEAALANGVFEGYTSSPTTTHVLTQVQMSDGRSVNYDYAVVADKLDGLSYVGLSAAHYGDNTTATYHYGFANDGSKPLLTEADDPRYDGKLKHVRYAYHQDLFESRGGAIHQEIGGDTGAVLSILEFDPAQPNRRIVNYGDLRTVTYLVDESTPGEFRVTDRTDSLGRSEHREYANSDSSGQPVAMIDHAGRRTERVRDERGRLLKVTRDGKILRQITRDADGHIQKVTGRDGYSETYTMDDHGRRVGNQHQDGSSVGMTYDALGRVATQTSPTGGVMTFRYDESGLLTAKFDANGRKMVYAYDKNNRLASKTDALGRTTGYEYNERGLKTKITQGSKTQLFVYDQYGRMTEQINEQGQSERRTYDELGRVVRQVDRVGRVTTYEYAQLPGGCSCSTFGNKPTKIVGPDGVQILRLYDTEGRLLSQTNAAGTPDSATTIYAYDQDDNLIASTDPLGQVTRYTYNDDKRRLSMTDPLGRVTRWTYNDAGDLDSKTTPDGYAIKKLYDARHRITQVTDAVGHVTRYEYDAAGHMIEVTDAAGKKTSYTYDAGGQQTSGTYPDGTKQTWERDAGGRVVKAVSPDGVASVLTYDENDHVLSQTDTVASSGVIRVQTFAYDTLGHRTAWTDALGHTTRWTYDSRGNVLTVASPDGTVASNTYDSQNHLLTATDAAGGTTMYTYDVTGNQVSLTDAKGNTYSFTNDATHRKTAMIYPNGSQEKWTYNLAGQLTAYTNRAGQTKTVAYNAAGQSLSETWIAAPQSLNPSVPYSPLPSLPAPTTYSYDAAGHLTQVDNGQAKLTYTYGDTGRVASETSDLAALVPGLDSQTVSYSFDELGRQASLTYPDRTKVRYEYDARGRLTTIDDDNHGRALAEYSYDQFGRPAKLTRDNGVVTSYTYDMAGQLTDIVHAQGKEVLAATHYTLDVDGRRTAQIREDNVTETYGYDATSQLTSVDYGAVGPTAGRASNETFSYDSVGNRTQVLSTFNAQLSTTAYATNALNQYIKVAGTAFTYDANGNLVDDGKQTYRYDSLNRLISVEPSASFASSALNMVRADFSYDARNRCILRRYYTKGSQGQWVLDNASSRAATYDTGWNLLSERKLNGDQVGEYIHGLRTDEILSVQIGSQTVYPLVDGLGSTVALADDKGKITERVRYSAFGTPHVLSADYRSLSTGSTYRFLFTGREWLANVGLNDHRNRYYSTGLGRWLTTDPIGYIGDIDLYRYVKNGPILLNDSAGLFEHPTDYQPVDSTKNTIVCNNGWLTVQNANTYPDSSCTQAHEQVHLNEWIARYGVGVCIGEPDGVQPVGGSNYLAFLKTSECHAYTAGRACRHAMVNNNQVPCSFAWNMLQDMARDDREIAANCP